MVLEQTLKSPLDSKEIQPVHSKGNQSWIFIGSTDIEAETPILWPPDAKNWLIWKDPDAGTDWRQEEKGMTEDEMVGWHHWLNGHEFELTPGVGDGQGGMVCHSPWGHKELDTIEWLNWTDNSVGKESACNAGDPSLIPGWGRSDRGGIVYPLQSSWASLVAQLVKNPPAMRETWVWSLGWKDPLEKGRLPTPVFWPGEFHGLYSA